MSQGTVRQWFEVYEQAQRKQVEGRAELARLGLVAISDDNSRPGSDSDFLSLDGEPAGTDRRDREPVLSRPIDAGMHMALLVGAGMIASLAVFFG
jgi:hypothetical protein